MSGDSAIKLALKARAARAQAMAALTADPVAIVGMACRLPGGVKDPEAFWTLLREGRDAVGRVPADRWDANSFYDPDLAAPGKSITREAGFLDRIDGFDADFFGILPREAEQMDPQQRVFLEVAVEALDDAGQPWERLARSRTGVYVASYHNDYAKLIYDDPDTIDLRSLTGTLHSVLANRLSWFLDLRGPSLSLDTACSSSLVAVHLACQSLRMGETDMALAGGVSLIVSPDLMISMSKVGFMSPDGRSKTFDASADGFGRGEGCSVVVLKRLADAVFDRDRILAVIRSSAVNQDGRSTLLAAPSGPAQEDLVREALARGQVDPARIGLVEAHGTGTALGDPIEVEALARTIGRSDVSAERCFLGSAKANIGHLEAAAGVTGLVKAVLALRHEAVPPQPHFTSINPHIDLAGTRLAVPTTLVPWPTGGAPRAAAVSSFGVGGTNAHVIVEEAPRLPPEPAGAASQDRAWLLPLSARSPAALQALAAEWAEFLSRDATPLADLCFTAGERRTHHPVRRAVAGRTREALQAALRGVSAEPAAQAAAAKPRIGFVFCGQGPQWFAMGRQLLSAEPVFRETMERCDALLQPLSGWSLLDALAQAEGETRLGSTMVAQPALFALQVSLAAQLRHWGVTPDAVVGHSIGEIAALHVAGVLELEEAIRIVWHRGRLMQQATGTGRMASAAMSPDEAEALVARHPGLDVAAVNAPRSVVLSGDPTALDEALAALDAQAIRTRKLPVDYAFHSTQMAPFQSALVQELGQVSTKAPDKAVYSTVTGARLPQQLLDAAYFGRNIRDTVRFSDACAAMIADGCDVVIEIGPHPVLGPAIQEIIEAIGERNVTAPRVFPALKRGTDEPLSLLGVVAGAYEAGVTPDWEALADGAGVPTALPTYPWRHKRYWLAARPSGRTAPVAAPVHPILGRAAPADGNGRRFDGASAGANEWLGDHRIFGETLLPGAAIIEAFAKAAELALGRNAALEFVVIDRPVEIPAEGVRWQLAVVPQDDAATTLTFSVADENGGWAEVASAAIALGVRPLPPPLPPEPADGSMQDAGDVYAAFERRGAAFGPCFRQLLNIRSGPGWAVADLAGEVGATAGYLIHPALLDAGLQLCSLAADAGDDAFVPVGADAVHILPWAGAPLRARVRARLQGRLIRADIAVETRDGQVVAGIEGASFARVDAAALAAARTSPQALYEESWIDAGAPSAPLPAGGAWLVLDDAAGICSDAITAACPGATLIRVRPGPGLQQEGPRSWRLTPAADADMRALFDAKPWGQLPLRGIVHGWSLDGGAAEDGGVDDALASLLHLVQAATALSVPLRVVTGGAFAVGPQTSGSPSAMAGAAAAGLAGVAAIEHPELQPRIVECDRAGVDARALGLDIVTSGAGRIALRDGRRFTTRLRAFDAGTSRARRPVRLSIGEPGDLSGLTLEPLQQRRAGPGEVRLAVRAAGLNFRDVLTTLGLYPGQAPPLGVECVGEVVECGPGVTRPAVGERVFGYAPGSLSEVVVPAAFVAPVPAMLDDDQAATSAVAFTTALYGLEDLAGLQPGERVLIHAAAGGVGLAAVQIALARGAIVHASASSPEKRDVLRALGVAHLHDSRSPAFADEILSATSGAGVDVVLNSLAGEFIDAGFRCLARGGRFLELGKRDVWSPERAAAERPDAAYHLYDLGSEAERHPPLFAGLMDRLVRRLESGELRPLPVSAYPLARASDAMRAMAQARHIGKLALRVAHDRRAPIISSADATYWITGGLGGVGLFTAEWLVRAGAHHLVLSGRNAPGEAAALRIAAMRAVGAVVHVEACDVADAKAVAVLLRRIESGMPPLRGVVHAAGVTHDGTLAHQGWAEARKVLDGKVHGALHLDRLTRGLQLDFFILYSAAATLLGGGGQGLYPAANAVLDALARQRAAEGLPALSVAWGLWSGVGMATGAGQAAWEARGLHALHPDQAFKGLEALLQSGKACGAVMSLDWTRFLQNAPQGLDRSPYAELARSTPAATTPTTRVDATALSPIDALRRTPPAQRREKLSLFLRDSTARILGLDDGAALAPRQPLKDFGVDSLMAVELRNLLVRAGGVPLPATLLFDHPTLDALTGALSSAWKLVEPSLAQKSPSAPVISTADLADGLTDEDLEALLREELAMAGGAA